MAKALKLEVIGEPLAGIRENFDPANRKRMLDRAVAAWRSVIREEFAKESWNRPSGGFFPWKALKKPRPGKKLYLSGKMFNAYMGGTGGFLRYVAAGVEFGVSGGVVPYAVVHRGGPGKITAASVRMYLNIPPRPHATANPEVRTRIAAIFSAGLAGKPLPPRLTA